MPPSKKSTLLSTSEDRLKSLDYTKVGVQYDPFNG